MDDVSKLLPINIDLADDHYDRNDKPVDKPKDGYDPTKTITEPDTVKAP